MNKATIVGAVFCITGMLMLNHGFIPGLATYMIVTGCFFQFGSHFQ